MREKDPSLSEAVEVVILKALSKKPEDRYVSIIGFAQALERASREYPSEMRPDTVIDSLDTPHLTIPRRVFLSYASLDDVTRLKTDLTIRDISVQHDSAADNQEEKTRQAIRAAQVILLVLTPQTRSSAVVKEHLRIADLYRRRIICVWEQGDDLHDLLPIGTVRHVTHDSIPGSARKNEEKDSWVIQSTFSRKARGKVAYWKVRPKRREIFCCKDCSLTQAK